MVYDCIRFIQNRCYPPVCLLCLWPVERGALDLCVACAADLPPNLACCPRCGLAFASASTVSVCGQCQRDPPPFGNTLAPWRYQPPLDYLLHRLKYNGDLSVARTLGEVFALEVARRQVRLPDLLVPVPLHVRRLRERGFNQAFELGRTLAGRSGIELFAAGLIRRLDTPPQAGLDARRRRGNLRAAFVADRRVRNRHVALLDDVMTTGSTAREASRSLLRAGAKSVSVWVLARA